jgi:isoquinoline 1-oxidoreductase subunit alpha
MAFKIKVNGVDRTADVDGDTPLLWVLRDVFGMTGTKFGCGMALCGACTALLDAAPTRSCITTIDSVGNAAVTTIEAIGDTPSGQQIQKAWLDLEVVQCGYCIELRHHLAASNAESNEPRPLRLCNGQPTHGRGSARPCAALRSFNELRCFSHRR